MLEKLLKLYIESLKIHIGTKTKDHLFHEFTQDVYELLFDIFHELAEKREDIKEGEYTSEDIDQSKQRIYDIVEQVKELVDDNKGDYGTGYDNLSRGLVDKLEFLCGNAQSFISEEEEEENNDYIEEKPKPRIKTIPKMFG